MFVKKQFGMLRTMHIAGRFGLCTRQAWQYPRAMPCAMALRALHTSSMTEDHIATLKVRRDRMMQQLHDTCQWGEGERWGTAVTETGMERLALTDADKTVRDWFVEEAKGLGCNVTVDEMGNIFAVRPGTKPDLPPIYAGSHLDTQPTGGRYDGILGIMAGLEGLRVLQENDIRTSHPIGLVNWTSEEGARFPITMISSGVWAGVVPLEKAYASQDVGGSGATVRSELERIGYMGAIPATPEASPMAAHFELHIEQGPILENNQQKIGVVNGAQAYKWFTVEVKGRAAHTGTTPMDSRGDALLAAARMINHSNIVANKSGALASTGILTLQPGSVNVIPSHVRFSLDVRSKSDAIVTEVEQQLKRDFAAIAQGRDVEGYTPPSAGTVPMEVTWATDYHSPAVHFDEGCINAVRTSAAGVLGGSELFRDMTSGAGHDSVNTSKHVPTAMIFVPSKGGISHHPEEWTSEEDCALGAAVLLHAMLRYDREHTSK